MSFTPKNGTACLMFGASGGYATIVASNKVCGMSLAPVCRFALLLWRI
jgi:hypothetical protein